MKRVLRNTIVVGAISLAIGVQPAVAAASPAAASPDPMLTSATAPFDPICPLCFVREYFDTLS